MVDTDKTDWEADGTILLPTISNCLEFGDKTYAEDGLERFKSEQWVPGMPTSIFEVYLDYILNKTKILPIISDPTDVDTDSDGYTDDVDPRPLISDVTRYEINMIENYIPVEYDSSTSYGGNQGWFSKDNWFSRDYIIYFYGCGITVACDLFLYLTLQNDMYRNNITDLAIEGNAVSRDDYITYYRAMDLLFFDNTYRWLGVLAPELISAIKACFSIAGIEYKASWSYKHSSTEMLSKIEEMLEKDIPVIFSVGPNTPNLWGDTGIGMYERMKKGDIGYEDEVNQLYQYSQIRPISGHYMTITGVIKDDIATKNTIMLKVASWGKVYYIDYDEYRQYIEDESGTWTSSMLYIK